MKPITYDESLKQKQENYNKLFDEKLDEIQELSKHIDYKRLNYDFTTKASGQSILLDIMVHLLFSRKTRWRHIIRNS